MWDTIGCPIERLANTRPRCYTIINGDTLEILGVADRAIADKNDDHRWVELEPHQLE